MGVSLKELNDGFLQGAEEYRYINGAGIFFNKKRSTSTPHNTTYLRSIKFKDDNKYLFVIDVDYETFDEIMLNVGKALYHTIYNLFGIKSIIKVSGGSGIQIVLGMNFPKHYEQSDCLFTMKNLAYTLWLLSSIQSLYGVKFGRYNKKDHERFIDPRLYERRRMIRSFSIHHKTKMFSVPIMPDDTYADAYLKSSLSAPLWSTPLEWLHCDEVGFLYRAQDGGSKAATMVELGALPQTTHEGPISSDAVFEGLPPSLKAVATFDGHIGHEYKWNLVVWMHTKQNMVAEDIERWIWKYCKWNDLDSRDRTAYHIRYTCQWADNIMAKNGREPLKKWVYNGVPDL